MNKQRGYTIVELVWVVLLVAGAVGWVWNIVRIVGHMSDPITGLFVVRCIGVFVAPVGAVLGYIPS